jgi:hypothetical protein
VPVGDPYRPAGIFSDTWEGSPHEVYKKSLPNFKKRVILYIVMIVNTIYYE